MYNKLNSPMETSTSHSVNAESGFLDHGTYSMLLHITCSVVLPTFLLFNLNI
jgi:hypothetical protein